MQNDGTHATYGYTWMLHTVQEWTAADWSKAGMHDELESYLKANLEHTVDVVGWWGVRIPPSLPWNMVLIWHRFTRYST
jgi:hypothetical protein